MIIGARHVLDGKVEGAERQAPSLQPISGRLAQIGVAARRVEDVLEVAVVSEDVEAVAAHQQVGQPFAGGEDGIRLLIRNGPSELTAPEDT